MLFYGVPFSPAGRPFAPGLQGEGKQMITSILSFDNITKRGWIPVLYDVYLLWNASNRAQLNRIYPNTKSNWYG